jgi:flagellar biosynthesis anti-sigma factor FlgM
MKIDRQAKVTTETGSDEGRDQQENNHSSGRTRSAEKEADMLAAKATQLPEMRSDKVASIRRAIQGGHYQLSPDQTADAMLSDMEARAARRARAAGENGKTPVSISEPLRAYRSSEAERQERSAPPVDRDDEFGDDAESSGDCADSDQMDSSA